MSAGVTDRSLGDPVVCVTPPTATQGHGRLESGDVDPQVADPMLQASGADTRAGPARSRYPANSVPGKGMTTSEIAVAAMMHTTLIRPLDTRPPSVAVILLSAVRYRFLMSVSARQGRFRWGDTTS